MHPWEERLHGCGEAPPGPSAPGCKHGPPRTLVRSLTDESYTLSFSKNKATITAKTLVGVVWVSAPGGGAGFGLRVLPPLP